LRGEGIEVVIGLVTCCVIDSTITRATLARHWCSPSRIGLAI
jgi:hypothetical protein